MRNFRKAIRDAVEQKKPMLGSYLQLPSPEIAEIYGYCGFDYIIIDNEHTINGPEISVSMVRAAEASDTLAMIRVPDIEEANIKKALDTGTSALLVPNVTSAEDVRRVIRYAKFAPLGMRGACPGVRANGYGTGGHEPYYKKANEYVAVLAQIETLEACNDIDEILEIEGLDGIWLAPVDLSMHMGHGGNAGHPEVIAALTKILERSKEKGKAVGAFALDIQTGKDWIEKGVTLLAYGMDGDIMRQTLVGIKKDLDI